MQVGGKKVHIHTFPYILKISSIVVFLIRYQEHFSGYNLIIANFAYRPTSYCQTSTKTMVDKKESPETEHLESDIKSKPSTLIPPPGLERQPYGEPGLKGILTNKYVAVCAAFATLGGAMFGYDQGVVSVTLTMDHFLARFPKLGPMHPVQDSKKESSLP
ncbi:unnamed protein product [Penicillium egyptiacum]|uniref:Major facilitator superfamily (MFS) profile domain-containing protein n=1 Tax=Penicillium egyptiacum TaxID=1303716 RepID=A0A9W4P6Y6_9EURO|nr:unnamed protein product [Penicillium egyptiacum]